MKQFLTWLKLKLTLNRVFYFEGTEEDLITNLDGLKTNKWRNGYFYSYFNRTGYYEICATFSVGTLRFRSLNGIKLHLIHQHVSEYRQQVNLFTKVRPENWFLLLLFFFLLVSSVIETNEDWYEFLLAIALAIISFLWFNVILKVQENILMTKTMKRLRLIEKK